MHPSSTRNSVGPGGPLLEKGDLVAGKYRVERVIGSGGMGQVLAARHIELGNLFAIKVLRPHNVDDATIVRFMREAQAIARLQNEHVVRVHDVGQTDTGLPYMVMEHLDGQDLGALLAARGPLGVDEAVGAILEACEGLADAHAIGIVHRDLKPQNLFLARKSAAGDAAVKVVDFGLAKNATGSHNNNALSAKATMQGEVVGTGGYMAPEQLNGEATPRSDVWSLGVCLYRLLTGKHPFEGRDAIELQVSAVTADFRPIEYFRTDVPPAIEAVIARCLRKMPQERYADARVLGDALLDAFSSEPMPESVTPVTPTRSLPRSATAIAHRREEETATIVAPNRQSWPDPAVGVRTTTTFTMSEQGLAGLDRKSRLMLLWSGIALTVALLFLFAAVSWRRSAQEAHRARDAREADLAAQQAPGFPPPPPLPPHPPEEAVTAVPPPPPPPPPPVEVATVVEPVATAAPEPPAPEPVAIKPPPPAPVVTTAPVIAEPIRKPVKKKALYDTP